MAEERCDHDLVQSQCGLCNRDPNLPRQVYVTAGGSAFHQRDTCEALIDGWRYAKRFGKELHEAVRMGVDEAKSSGRAPCEQCIPHQ